MFRKSLGYFIAVLFLLGAGSLWYFWQHRQARLPTLHNAVIPVRVTTVRTASIPHYLETMGTLQAQQSANISANISGKVTAILYQPGTFVKKGTPLIQLNNQTYQADFDSARAALALTKVNFQRNQSLAKIGAESKQSLDQARADYLEAQAKVKSTQTLLNETTILAPFDGYIGPKNVSVGDYVQAGQTLTILVDRQLLRVDYQFPEKYLPQLRLGQTVIIRLPGQAKMTNREYKGTLIYIAPAVDPSTHSIVLQAEIPNPDNSLAPGLFVKVRQSIGVRKTAVVVPEESIIPTISGAQVYRIVKGKAIAVNVKIGVTFNNQVEILEGLQAGDVVVIAGQQLLNTGSPVKIIQDPPSSSSNPLH